MSAKKLKNEAQLLKEAVKAGMEYGEKRGVVEFEPTDSLNDRLNMSINCWSMTRSLCLLPVVMPRSRICAISWRCGWRASCQRITRC
jgi:hypothetical protein